MKGFSAPRNLTSHLEKILSGSNQPLDVTTDEYMKKPQATWTEAGVLEDTGTFTMNQSTRIAPFLGVDKKVNSKESSTQEPRSISIKQSIENTPTSLDSSFEESRSLDGFLKPGHIRLIDRFTFVVYSHFHGERDEAKRRVETLNRDRGKRSCLRGERFDAWKVSQRWYLSKTGKMIILLASLSPSRALHSLLTAFNTKRWRYSRKLYEEAPRQASGLSNALDIQCLKIKSRTSVQDQAINSLLDFQINLLFEILALALVQVNEIMRTSFGSRLGPIHSATHKVETAFDWPYDEEGENLLRKNFPGVYPNHLDRSGRYAGKLNLHGAEKFAPKLSKAKRDSVEVFYSKPKSGSFTRVYKKEVHGKAQFRKEKVWNKRSIKREIKKLGVDLRRTLFEGEIPTWREFWSEQFDIRVTEAVGRQLNLEPIQTDAIIDRVHHDACEKFELRPPDPEDLVDWVRSNLEPARNLLETLFTSSEDSFYALLAPRPSYQRTIAELLCSSFRIKGASEILEDLCKRGVALTRDHKTKLKTLQNNGVLKARGAGCFVFHEEYDEAKEWLNIPANRRVFLALLKTRRFVPKKKRHAGRELNLLEKLRHLLLVLARESSDFGNLRGMAECLEEESILEGTKSGGLKPGKPGHLTAIQEIARGFSRLSENAFRKSQH